MLCQDSINDLELPIPFEDGKHYVSFKDNEELIEKINYYLQNKDFREKIALNGRKF
jgi:spore maturation protein CgeB